MRDGEQLVRDVQIIALLEDSTQSDRTARRSDGRSRENDLRVGSGLWRNRLQRLGDDQRRTGDERRLDNNGDAIDGRYPAGNTPVVRRCAVRPDMPAGPIGGADVRNILDFENLPDSTVEEDTAVPPALVAFFSRLQAAGVQLPQ